MWTSRLLHYMLCICYWLHFTCETDYQNMVDFKYTKWNEKIVSQIPFQQNRKKKTHKMEIQSKSSKQKYLIVVV
jgi:hypothetical protein